MFTHVVVGANDIAASREFYDAIFGALGVPVGKADDKGKVWWMTPRGAFGITRPIDGEDACHANGGTIGLAAADEDAVKAFHAAGIAHGGTAIEDPPGPRQGTFGTLELAYLRDPSGNKVCAVHRLG